MERKATYETNDREGVGNMTKLLLGLFAVGVLQACQAVPAAAQVARFRYDPDRVDAGTLLLYEKSNVDGTHAGKIALYIAAEDRLEAFKWHEGGNSATLVIAEMNWDAFSVRRFESWRLHADGTRQLQGTLEQIDGEPKVVIAFGPDNQQTVELHHWPWHSYDFDLASLSASMRHLIDPEATFQVGIADLAMVADTLRFVEKGTVTIEYLGREDRNGIASRKYAIDGEGLAHRGGYLWMDAERGYIVDYEIDLPDEPGFESGKLRLLARRSLDQTGWEHFMQERLD